MASLLFVTKIGAIGAKILGGAAIVKAAPFIVPIACAAVCVTATVAGARYLAKKKSKKEYADASRHRCASFADERADDHADENSTSYDTSINDLNDNTDINEIE